MDLQAGRFAGFAEPVAHLLVLRPERQPPHAALWRRAEFRGFVNRVPKPGGIDLQIGGDLGHSAIPVISAVHALRFNDAASPARQ